jgi:hypothetical protein
MNALQLTDAAFDLPEDVVSNAEGNELNFRVAIEVFVEQAALNHFDATGEIPPERVMTEARRLLTEKVEYALLLRREAANEESNRQIIEGRKPLRMGRHYE